MSMFEKGGYESNISVECCYTYSLTSGNWCNRLCINENYWHLYSMYINGHYQHLRVL